MALNLKKEEVERLAAEVARLANETKTEAIRRSLLDRKQRLLMQGGQVSRREKIESFLRTRVWPEVPPNMIGRRISKRERERILGYGSHGV